MFPLHASSGVQLHLHVRALKSQQWIFIQPHPPSYSCRHLVTEIIQLDGASRRYTYTIATSITFLKGEVLHFEMLSFRDVCLFVTVLQDVP